MDENLIKNLKHLLESDTDLIPKISEYLTKSNKDVSQISFERTEISSKYKKQEMLKTLLPLLDEKSKRITEYIIAAMKISEIISELKNKYP